MTTTRFRCIPATCACLAFLAALGGCATIDQKIGLNYARQNDSIVKHSGEVVVTYSDSSTLSRNSAGEWIIGSLNNVHGVHQANLLSDRSPGEWIAQALLYELRMAGYSASLAPVLAGSSRGIQVSDIELVFQVNKGVVTADTRQELKFNVNVFRGGSKVKTFTVASRDNRTFPVTASAEDKEKVMLVTLQDAMRQLMPDIITQIEKK